jgi:hypothetical protein
MDKDILVKDVERGRRAEHAYENYLAEHLNTVRAQLFNAFCGQDLPPEELIKLKGLASAINGLESSIFTDIDNAKLASKQLSELNN